MSPSRGSDIVTQVASVMVGLPIDRQRQVLDFARFIATQSDPFGDDQSIVTAEQLDAEDAVWDAITAKYAGRLPEIVARIEAEVSAGLTYPMFDDSGRWLLEDVTDENEDGGA